MSVIVTVLDAQKAVSTHTVTKGEALVLQAQNNVNYQLIDELTGLGPQNIVAKRTDNNLVILLDDGNTEPDIIIENYYSQEGTNMIIGQHENGQLYAYVPQSGNVADSVSVLAQEMSASQALGGVELVAPFWAFSPWWLAGVAGVAAVASVTALSGGSNSNVADTNAPERPTAKLKHSSFDENGKPLTDSISGTAEQRATVKLLDSQGNPVLDANSKPIETTVGSDGKYEFKNLPTLAHGQTYQVVVTDAGNNTSLPAKVVGDTLAPKAPIVESVRNGTNDEGAPITTISGKGQPGNVVEIKDPVTGEVKGSAEVKDNGEFSISVAPMATGDRYDVVESDPAGNASKPSVANGNTDKVNAPTLVLEENTNGTLTAKGAAAPFADVFITFPNGDTGTVKADDKGNYALKSTAVQPAGQKDDGTMYEAKVYQINPYGNKSEEVSKSYDKDNLEPSVELKDTIYSKDDNGAPTQKVSGKTEPGATVNLKGTDGKTYPVTVDDNGEFSATVPAKDENGNPITYTVEATDINGNTGKKAVVADNDTVAPQIEVTTDKNGRVVVSQKPNTAVEPNADVTVRFPDGTTQTVKADEKGQFVPVISEKPQQAGDEKAVSAKAEDDKGNSATTTATTDVPVTAPTLVSQKPTQDDETGQQNGNELVIQAQPNTPFIITDANGEKIGEGTTNENGLQTVTTTRPLVDGEAFNVIAQDPNDKGNATKQVSTEATADNVPPSQPSIKLVQNDDGTVSVLAGDNPAVNEPGAIISVTFPDNTTGTTTVKADGTFEPITSALPQPHGELSVTQTDQSNQTSEPSKSEYLDGQEPQAPTVSESKTLPNGNTQFNGKAEPNSVVKLTDKDGNVVGTANTDDKGNFTLESDKPLTDGESYNLTATDAHENTSPVATQTVDSAVAKPAIQIKTNADGTLSVEPALGEDDLPLKGENGQPVNEPGSTIEVTFPDGSTGTATVNDDGSFTPIVSDKPQTSGDVVANITDSTGNQNSLTEPYRDTQAPSQPTATAKNSLNEFGEPTATTVSGTAEPGSTVTLTDPETNKVLGTAKADEKGIYSITTDAPLADKPYNVTATDAAGLTSEPKAVSGDNRAPAQPSVSVTQDQDGTVRVSPTLGEDSQPLKGKDGQPLNEPGSTISVTFPDGTTGTAVVNEDGSFAPIVSDKPQTSGGEVSAVATDALGNPSDPTLTKLADDEIAPSTPVVESVSNNHQDNTTTINGTAEPGSTVTLKDKDGKVIGETQAKDDGTFSLVVPTLANKAPFTLTATDENDNTSGGTEIVGDTDAPSKPNVESVTNRTVTDGEGNEKPVSTVSGKVEGEPKGTKVEVIDPRTNQVVGRGEVGDNGTFSLDTDKPLEDGVEFIVRATDEKGNVSEDGVATGDLTAPKEPQAVDVTNKFDETGKLIGATVSGKAPEGAKVGDTVKVYTPNGVVEGKVEETPVLDEKGQPKLDEDGKPMTELTYAVELTEPMVEGTEYPVTVTDDHGNESKPTTVVGDNTPTKTPAQPSLQNTFDDKGQVNGAVVSGNAPEGAKVGDTVKVYDPTGKTVLAEAPITQNEEGKLVYAVNVPQPLTDGATYPVSVTDDHGNESPKANVVGDTTASLSNVTFTNGNGKAQGDANAIPTKVSGDASGLENGQTVSLYDGDKLLGTGTVQDGKFEITLTDPSKTLESGKNYTVSANDKAGNPASVSVAGDNTGPTGTVSATLTNKDANNDGTPESSEIRGTVSPMTDVKKVALIDPTTKKPVLDAQGNPITADVKPNGDYTLSAPLLDNNKPYEVVALDENGNPSKPATVTGDTDKPSTLTNPTANTVTVPAKEEGGQSTQATAISFDAPTSGSDASNDVPNAVKIQKLDENGQPTGEVSTVPAKVVNGKLVVDPVDLPSGEYNVTPVDAAGNAGEPTKVTIDRTPPSAPTSVGITNGEDVNKDGQPDSTTVKVGLPADVKVGDVVEITKPDGTKVTQPITAADIAKKAVDVEVSPALENGKTYPVAFKDAAGNVSTPVNATGDTVEPSKPTSVGITNGADANNDGQPDSTTVKVGLPADVKVGDVVEITKPDGTKVTKPITAADIAKKEVDVAVSPALENGKTYPVAFKDAAGNVSTPVNATGDTDKPSTLTNPTANTVTVPAKEEGGQSTQATAISFDAPTTGPEASKDAPTSVNIQKLGENGQPTGEVTNVPAKVVGGKLVVDPVDLPDGKYNVTPVDAAGNAGEPTAVVIDRTPPSAPTSVGITNGEDVNKDGKPDSTTVKVGLPADVKAGDVVEITKPDGTKVTKEITAADIAKKTVDVEVSSALDDGKNYPVAIKDTAGNVLDASNPVTLTANQNGSVTIKPGADNEKLVIKYTNEDNIVHGAPESIDEAGRTANARELVLEKRGDTWGRADNQQLPTGIKVTGDTITFEKNATLEGTTVSVIASATNKASAIASGTANNDTQEHDRGWSVYGTETASFTYSGGRTDYTWTAGANGDLMLRGGGSNEHLILEYTDNNGERRKVEVVRGREINKTGDNADKWYQITDAQGNSKQPALLTDEFGANILRHVDHTAGADKGSHFNRFVLDGTKVKDGTAVMAWEKSSGNGNDGADIFLDSSSVNGDQPTSLTPNKSRKDLVWNNETKFFEVSAEALKKANGSESSWGIAPVTVPETSFKLGDDPYDTDTLGSMTAFVDNSDALPIGATWAVTYTGKTANSVTTLKLTKGVNGWALDEGQAETSAIVSPTGSIVFAKGTLQDTTELTSVVKSGTATDTAATRAPISASNVSGLPNGTLYDGDETDTTNYDDVIVLDEALRDLRGNNVLNLGRGEDKLVIGQKGQDLSKDTTGLFNSEINMGEGNDTVVIYDKMRNSTIDMGEGHNRITLGSMHGGGATNTTGSSLIKAGSGDDLLEFVTENRTGDRHRVGIRGSARVDLGDGNNVIDTSKADTGVNFRAELKTGSGNDTFNLRNSILQPALSKPEQPAASNTDHSQVSGYIYSGAGNDLVKLGGSGSLISSTPGNNQKIDSNVNTGHGVDLGEGDDTLIFDPVIPKSAGTPAGSISLNFIGTYETGEFKGGEGFDQLVMNFNTQQLNADRNLTSGRGYHTDDEFKLNLYLVEGFEVINMSYRGKHKLANVIELNAETSVQYSTAPTGVALAKNQGTIGNTSKTGLLVKGDNEDTVDLAGRGKDLKQADTLEYEGATYDHYEFQGSHIYIQQGINVM